MKRLFKVADSNGKALLDNEGEIAYFADKPSAKAIRNHANNVVGKSLHHVAIGPDHQGLRSRKSRGHIKANRTHA